MFLQICIGPFCFSLCHIVPLLLVICQYFYKHIAKFLGLEKVAGQTTKTQQSGATANCCSGGTCSISKSENEQKERKSTLKKIEDFPEDKKGVIKGKYFTFYFAFMILDSNILYTQLFFWFESNLRKNSILLPLLLIVIIIVVVKQLCLHVCFLS